MIYQLCRLLHKLPSEVEAEDVQAMGDFIECMDWEKRMRNTNA